MTEKTSELNKNIIVESLINYLKDDDVKKNIKDIIKQ